MTISKDIFIDRLSKVIKFIPKKAIFPVLDSVLLRADKNCLEMIASDLQTQISITMPVDSSEPLSFCLPAHLLLNTVKLLTDEYVTISQKKNQIEIKSGKSKYKITPADSPDNFPLIAEDQYPSEAQLYQKSLKRGFFIAQSFIDNKNAKENLRGMKIEEIEGKIIITGACDAVIARGQINPISITKWDPITIAADTANKICSLLEGEREVTIFNSAGKISFLLKEEDKVTKVTSTVLERKPVDTEKFFKTRPGKKIKLHTLEAKNALARIALYANEQTQVVALKSDETASQLTVAGDDIDYGKEGEDVITFEGPPVDLLINFNCEYLLCILNSIEENFFDFLWDTPHSPALIIPEGNEDESFSFLIAPIRQS